MEKIYFHRDNDSTTIDGIFWDLMEDELFKRTYCNPEMTAIDCYEARRSFEDLHSIINTYSSCTTQDLAEYIIGQILEKRVYVSYCPDIDKWVFEEGGMSSLPYYNRIYCKGNGEYSLYEIVCLAGEQLKNEFKERFKCEYA